MLDAGRSRLFLIHFYCLVQIFEWIKNMPYTSFDQTSNCSNTSIRNRTGSKLQLSKWSNTVDQKFITMQISPRCLSILKTKSKCVLGIQPMHDIYRDDHLGCCFEICHILKRNPQDLKKYLLDTVAVRILVKLVNLDQKWPKLSKTESV